ncbi:hypothetical protein CHS0354_015727 [Potamilus streckersoni]|uniref:Uncharacterized protein n=1 Tax=Potamilus streckersoni TaxID=2493646 RepID=A0AAE0WFQ0_9BIVA|nr:hypothetical protein CHS0354_015727 [Potamilus streckersoni]
MPSTLKIRGGQNTKLSSETYIQMVAQTGYFNGGYTKVYNYKSNSRHVDCRKLNRVPILIATVDNKCAMGVHTPSGQDMDTYRYYAVNFFPVISDSPGKTSKWNIVFRTPKPRNSTTYMYKTYICVGDLNIVQDCFGKVIHQSKAS